MRTTIIIFKSIFAPFSAFSFLILGLLACFCSATIEFFVFRELLAIPTLGIDSNSWAALIVLVLEGSKFTLHYYGESLKKPEIKEQIHDFNLNHRRKLITIVKSMLISLSLACSIICVVNILYTNNFTDTNTTLAQNKIYCENQLELGMYKLENQKLKQIKPDMTT